VRAQLVSSRAAGGPAVGAGFNSSTAALMNRFLKK
jgi:hypothetical protein